MLCMIWDGCRKRHCLGDGLITQSLNAWSELLKSAVDVFIYKLDLLCFPRLWPVTCRYAAIAISINKWEKAFETEFKDANYALGRLVFYRTKFPGIAGKCRVAIWIIRVLYQIALTRCCQRCEGITKQVITSHWVVLIRSFISMRSRKLG